MSRKINTPFGVIRIERRAAYPRHIAVLTTLLAVLLAFLAVAIILVLIGIDFTAAFTLIVESFTKPELMLNSVKQAIPICLSALGLGIAFKMNFWNIGAEGQIYVGMIASTGVVLLHAYYGLFDEHVLLPLMFLTSFALGGLWCLLPAFLKAKMNVNEILTTLMLNYVAILLVDYLIHGPWRDPGGYGFPLSIKFPDYAKLLFLFGDTAYTGLLMAILGAAAAYLIMDHSKLGFEIKVVGQNLNVARYSGIDVSKVIMFGAFIAGGLAGIGGLSIVSGIIGRLRPRASPGYGYTAIIVAALAGLNPWLIVLASIFFGGLLTAGDVLQASMNIPKTVIQMMQAIIFLFILMGEVFKRYRIVFEGKSGGDMP
ncbi:MAG: ABC transporter permease [Aigarchaeota archaeon]|nr:ABC transporter permease [Aigarchaeota archaeon]